MRMRDHASHHMIWSRRSLLGAGLAAVPLAAWSEPIPPADTVTTGSSGRNLLTIDVSLDGRGPFSFVVDTGADRSVIADNVVAGLGLQHTGPVLVEGVVRTIETRTVPVARLAAGPVERNGLDMPVLPRAQLMADGYLGLDVLNGYRVSMDFRRGELRLMEPRSVNFIGNEAPNEVPIHLTGNNGHLRATSCLIDGVRATAFIDTGAEISVGNRCLFQALLHHDTAYNMPQIIPLTGVTGGVMDGHVTVVRRIKVGGLDIDNSAIAIADLQIFRLWGLSDTPALLIGMNWLRRFNRVSVDYGRKELRFDLASKVLDQHPLQCSPGAPGRHCPYLIGSPNTIPRPSVAT